jgi:hypothetical protein
MHSIRRFMPAQQLLLHVPLETAALMLANASLLLLLVLLSLLLLHVRCCFVTAACADQVLLSVLLQLAHLV